MIKLLKKIPIDFGQKELQKTTMGKHIAMELVGKEYGKKVLDAGCRDGIQSEIFKKKGYNVISIDINKSYNHCKIVDLNKKLPFKNNSFDLIWCSEVLEHLRNPKMVIEEFRRITKREGRIIITTPNSFFWFYKLFLFFGISPDKLQNKDHDHFFSLNDIKSLFPKAKIYGFFPYFPNFKFKIKRFIGILSPTFVIYEKR